MKKLFYLLFLFLTFVLSATTYKVATDGSGDYTTIAQVNSGTYSAGDSILFKRGDAFAGTININQNGTSGNNIIFGAYGSGANPVIYALTNLTGWTDNGGGVYYCSHTSSLDLNLLLIDDTMHYVGRFPNTGYLLYQNSTSTNPSATITSSSLNSATTDWTGAELALKRNSWTIGKHDVSAHSSQTLTFDYTSFETVKLGSEYGFFIQRDLRTLDEYGEWFYDSSTNRMYVYFGTVDPSTKTIQTSAYDYGVEEYYRGYITIENLTFEGQNLFGIWSDSPYSFEVKNCSIHTQGGQGLVLYGGQDDLVISDNYITDCNGEGSRIGYLGTTDGLIFTGNTISRCSEVAGMGNERGTYDAAYLRAYNSTITNNTISGSGYNGISGVPPQSGAIIIRYNLVENTNQLLPDGASIYTWQEFADTTANQIQIEIDHNVIKNSPSIGIYSDGYTNHLYIHDNTTIDVKRGTHANEPRYNVWQDNTFFNCRQYGVRLQNAQGAAVEARESRFVNNIIHHSGFSSYSIRDGNNTNIFNLGRIDSNYVFMIVGDTVADGYYFDPGFIDFDDNASEWQSRGFDVNSDFYSETAVIRYNATMIPTTAFADSSGTLADGTTFTNGVSVGAFESAVAYNVTAPTTSGRYYTALKDGVRKVLRFK